jgi:putative transposase
MARKKQTEQEKRKQALIKELYQMGCLNTAVDINNVVKEMIAGIVGGTLEAEMDSHLGYATNDRPNKTISNSRNGHNAKKLETSYGKTDLKIPRDRDGEFEPTVVEKHKRSINREIENKIIGLLC